MSIIFFEARFLFPYFDISGKICDKSKDEDIKIFGQGENYNFIKKIQLTDNDGSVIKFSCNPFIRINDNSGYCILENIRKKNWYGVGLC